MDRSKTLLAALGLALALGVTACEEADGPFEQAGEAADEAVNDVKRAVEDAKD